jgi:hypothetical protein
MAASGYLRKMHVDVYLFTQKCIDWRTGLYCSHTGWAKLREIDGVLKRYSCLDTGIGPLRRTSGIVDGYQGVEFYSWIWEAEKGGKSKRVTAKSEVVEVV